MACCSFGFSCLSFGRAAKPSAASPSFVSHRVHTSSKQTAAASYLSAPWRPHTPASEASAGRCGGQGDTYTIGLLPLHQAAALLLQEQDRIHLAFGLFDEMPDRDNKPIGELPVPILLSLCKPAFEPK
jgi:hypothetical protein